MAVRFLIPALAVLTIGVAPSPVDSSSTSQVEPTPEGRAPTRAELTPAVEAAFPRESYAPGETAKLVISNRAQGIQIQIFRSGPERIVTRSNLSLNGVPVTGIRSIKSSDGHRVVRVPVGAWPSGLYFARLRAADGRVGFAPFVVRPRWLGVHRVAVVLPTLTWQAYNLRDEDDDGIGDSWYAAWKVKSVRLGRPYLNRGVRTTSAATTFRSCIGWRERGRTSTFSRSPTSNRRAAHAS